MLYNSNRSIFFIKSGWGGKSVAMIGMLKAVHRRMPGRWEC